MCKNFYNHLQIIPPPSNGKCFNGKYFLQKNRRGILLIEKVAPTWKFKSCTVEIIALLCWNNKSSKMRTDNSADWREKPEGGFRLWPNFIQMKVNLSYQRRTSVDSFTPQLFARWAINHHKQELKQGGTDVLFYI